MKAVHQVLATLGDGDAIGNQVLAIQRVLRAAGYVSEIFVEAASLRLEPLTRTYESLRDFSHHDNLLIHHFSLSSRASRTAYALPDRMLLIYHNVTPAEYFVSFDPALARRCLLGRQELQLFAGRCDLALGASEFNRRELEAAGFAPTAVLPAIADFSHLNVPPSPVVTAQFNDEWTNILFVGRLAPNKKIEDLIRCFHAYQTHFNPRSRLLIVGSDTDLDRYAQALTGLIARLRQKHVTLTGHVSNAELTAFYDVADLFLCASEHEGFCVPLVEAFYKQVPVLAYAAAAVPETMDGAGVLYDDRDPQQVAALMNAVLSEPALEEAIVNAQLAACRRLESKDFAGMLVGFVEQALRSPRKPAPAVDEDVWKQLDDDERLGALTIPRPSASLALAEAR